ncbi:MAG: CHASE2 domain-containing protein, partial [Geminicoccaceae bacterium]
MQRIEAQLLDLRFRLRPAAPPSAQVVLVLIDEESIREIGRWPWSRNVMAELVDKLFTRYDMKLVGFDVVWAERDASSGIDVLDALARSQLKEVSAFQSAYAKLREDLDFDGRFAASLRGKPVV